MPVQSTIHERWSTISPLISQLHSGYSFFPRNNDTLVLSTEEPSADAFRILIVRASPYADVEESLTHLVLFDLIKRHRPDAMVDFAFFPDKHDQDIFKKNGIPWPLAINSIHHLVEFDLVLINISYVLELLNLPHILNASGMPLWSSDRNGGHPLVVVGGSASLAAQSTVKKTASGFDSLCDLLFFGELEDSVVALLAASDPMNPENTDRESQLRNLSIIEGCWVPRFQNEVRKAVCKSVDANTFPVAYPVLNGRDAATVRIQISYGCPFSCTFCFEGFERKPYRDRDAKQLLEATAELRRKTGAKSLDIVSFNFNTHVDLTELMPGFSRQFRHVHFMSQRLDILQNTKFLLENELAADKRSFTLGIEGISVRFRKYYEKKLEDADIQQLCLRLFQAKVKEIKLFFIISGLETEQDLDELSQFLGAIQEKRRNYHPGCRLIASFGVLCRMPFTPLQFSPLLLDDADYAPLIEACRKNCRAAEFEFRTAFSIIEYQLAQLLCLGSWNTNELLMDLYGNMSQFVGSLPAQTQSIVKKFMLGYDKQTLTEFLQEKKLDWDFPFNFVDMGFSQSALYARYQHCLDAMAQSNPMPKMNNDLKTPKPGRDQQKILSSILSDKQRIDWSTWKIIIPASMSGASPSWIDAWLARGFFELLSDQFLVNDIELDERFRNAGNIPRFWHGEALVRLSTTLSTAELKNRLCGKVTSNGMQILGIWEKPVATLSFDLFTLLPTSLEIAAHEFAKLLPHIGLNATITKSADRIGFIFSPRQAGKKYFARLQLSRAGEQTGMDYTLGSKADIEYCFKKVFGNKQYPVLFTAIRGII